MENNDLQNVSVPQVPTQPLPLPPKKCGKKIIIIILVIIVCIALYMGLSRAGMLPSLSSLLHRQPKINDKGATAESINSVINANNQFALKLYAELKNDNINVFFSPYSISTALAMVYEGARGGTADEIRSVFNFPADDGLRRSSFAAIHNQINDPNAKYKFSIANALWAQKDYKILSTYKDTLAQYYAAEANNVDFISATEQARQTINKWVEDKTNGKIKDLFPQGTLDNMTRLALTDAIYFKGTWVKQFQKDLTRDVDFRTSPDNTVKVSMMERSNEDARFNYAETDNLQILEMPYDGNKLSMMVLLPKNDDLTTLENGLTLENINSWRNQLEQQRVDVYMPKFTFKTNYLLRDILAGMGMPTAFTSAADFSGMDGTKNLSIQYVIHQAFVDVNEEGTEAAAATGVSMGLTAIAPGQTAVFRADHPFIFTIQDSTSGNILFIGRVSNPNI